MPKVLKSALKAESQQSNKDGLAFPVEHYSASSMAKFSTNQILFKILYINKDKFDTAIGVSAVLGSAFHRAMEVYYGGTDEVAITSEAEAIEYGLKAGMDFIDKYNDGFVEYSKTIANKQDLFDRFTFAFNSYVKEKPYKPETLVAVEEGLLEKIDVKWRGQDLILPVKMKGYIDKIEREDGKLKIKDYKTCYSFSDPDKIDAKKIVQAVAYYLLAYAKYEEEPYSVTFEEVKYTKNKDGGKQVREYEIVFGENDLFFDFFFRYYDDMTRALNGEQVYVPNFDAMYDNEVAIIAYIHRLDIPEHVAELMKERQVTNITDLLKTEIRRASTMKQLQKKLDVAFVQAKNINYEKMKNEEKIQTKMLEHGMALQFDSLIHGASVDLYRFNPSFGLKMSRLANYTSDIEQVLGVRDVRILAPIPGSTMVGFEVPRKDRTFPTVPSVQGFEIAIGQDIMGRDRRFDFRTAPHILVAGASGGGKSVWLNNFIDQINEIPNMEMHLFDPKRVELKQHKGKPSVLEYAADTIKIYSGLKKLVEEMKDRYIKMENAGTKNITEMPDWKYKIVVIDEYGQLMVSDEVYTEYEPIEGSDEQKAIKINLAADIERFILQIAQLGRAAGFHIVIATQSPRAEVINGKIKANFPTKVVFKTSKALESLIVIDEKGAEKLLGFGDMIFAGDCGMERLQGYKPN